MPKPCKQAKQSFQDYNKEVLSNLEGMVEDGRVNIRDYAKLKQSAQLFKLHSSNIQPNQELKNEWHWGPTGLGKSRHCRTTWPDAYIKMPNKWWDGYENEETVLIEDVQKEHHMLGYHFKIWADHYPFKAEVKGTTITLRPARVIITSNYSPADIWTDPAILEAIMRRFKVIEYKPKVSHSMFEQYD